MDKRINYKIVIDTETCPLDNDLEEVTPFNMFVYDVGWAVVDKNGNVYETKSYVNADVFCGEKDLMKNAYYADKIPTYWNDIKDGKRTLTSWYNIRKDFAETVKKYEVTEVYAHNMHFDYGTLQNTQRWLTKSKFRWFFPYGVEICDTLKMSKDVLGKMPTYKNFCIENGYLTKNNRPRFTAEIIYRFITGDTEFVEEHTGLADVLIEKEILAYCYRQHKAMSKEPEW